MGKGYGGRTLKPLSPLADERNIALGSNTNIRNLYCTYLHDIAISRFKWENLPREIDERFLELTLNEYGTCAFFRDEYAGLYVTLPATPEGLYDIYNRPNRYRAFANNGYTRHLDFTNSVFMYNNMARTPTWPWLNYYANQLYDIDATRTVNLIAQKTPIMLVGNDKQRLTAKNLYLNYRGNEPVMFVDESMGTNPIQVLQTTAPYLGEDLTNLRKHVLGEILTLLGYENSDNTRKNERLITGELQMSKGETNINRYSPLEARRQAADQINEMFHFEKPVEVNFRQASETVYEAADALQQLQLENPSLMYAAAESGMKGGVQNGEVHN